MNDEFFATLIAWLKANNLICRIPKKGPIVFEKKAPRNDQIR